MLTNLTQHFLGGQNSNFQKQRRVEVGVEPRQPNIPQGNFKLHQNQLFKEDSSELLGLSPSGQSHSLTNVREVVRVSADALQGFNLDFLPWTPRAWVKAVYLPGWELTSLEYLRGLIPGWELIFFSFIKGLICDLLTEFKLIFNFYILFIIRTQIIN